MGTIDARLNNSRGRRQVARGVPRLAVERKYRERDAPPEHRDGHNVAPRQCARACRVPYKRADRRLLRVHRRDHDRFEGNDEADGVVAVPSRERYGEKLGDDPTKRGAVQQHRPEDPPYADLGAAAEQQGPNDAPQEVHHGRHEDDEGRQDDITEGTHGDVWLTRGQGRHWGSGGGRYRHLKK